MLSLDDPRWSELQHAYGPASDIPPLLHDLARAPGPQTVDAEPWFSLWSSLCHQGDVYSASYAAAPHILQIALTASGPIDFSFFQLPAAIEIARATDRGPPVPDFLKEAYDTGLHKIWDGVAAHRNDPWDQSMVLSVMAALATLKGNIEVAVAISNLDDYWIRKINDQDED